MNIREYSPVLAYLSLCGTGQIRDQKVLDDSIHLISAFQVAEFRHVIGTFVGGYDELCVNVARITYETMKKKGFTDDSVCGGLHLATREHRDRWLDDSAQAKGGSEMTRKADRVSKG